MRPIRAALPLIAAAVVASLAISSISETHAKDNMSEKAPKYALAMHGGAGTILRENMAPEREAAYREKLAEALAVGEKVLANGGAAADAVIATIQVMEESPLFNAGRGAVFTSEGKNELDAAIMDGRDLNAGAIAGVTTVKSPIALARAVMDISPHVMLIGPGAERFAAEHGQEIVDPEYFYTERRWEQLQHAKETKSGAVLDHDGDPEANMAASGPGEENDYKYGTVGAAALDMHGNLAAGTSTGGMTNKQWGRVGDVPVIGAGTYASNASCAVSATGHGEYFIRATVGRSICALMEMKGMSLQDAANTVVMEQLVEMGGDGGIISVDKDGNVALVFNSAGMYRGSVRAGEEPHIAIYGDDE